MDKRIIEQFNLHSPFKLEDATVLILAQVGSHSHNTYVPKDDPQAIDDIDYMGIVIPPASFTFGIREWENTNFQFEELDCVFYSFRKFMKLLVKANPNVLGLLYMRPEHELVKHKMWQYVKDNRALFSSLESYHSFTGYAFAQFKKMTAFDLKTQTEWDDALRLIEAAGWTKEQIIQRQHRAMPNTQLVLRKLFGNDTFGVNQNSFEEKAIEHLDRAVVSIEKIHARHFQGYMGEKRKNLVKKYGYDTKNAAHLIRLMRMCNEFLQTGEFNVFRTHDAQEIRDIKSGKWTLEQVQQEATKLFERAKELKEVSTLPEEPPMDLIDTMAKNVYMTVYKI